MVLTFAMAAVAALPALWPLARPGFFVSDDGLFHIYRLAALDEALRAGVLFPRWFPDFAFGYGYPVLNFYSPLSYYLAEAFHLVVADSVAATKWAFAASLILSGLGMYGFGRSLLGPWGAGLAALAYVYAPYHLADVYRRGALAESLAFVFFPLILWSCRRLALHRRWEDAGALALSAGGLVLTHNLSAMLVAPLAAAYLLLSLAGGDRERGNAAVSGGPRRGLALGLAAAGLVACLSAFYVLPVLAEGRFAHLSYDYDSTGYIGHLAPIDGVVSPSLVYRYHPDQGVAAERPLGLAQAGLAALCLVLLVMRIRRRLAWREMAFWWVALLCGVGMTTQLSFPVWQALQPALSMVQYPWRFMALVDLCAAVLVGSLVSGQPASLGSVGGLWRALLGVAATVALMVNALPALPTPALELAARDVSVERMWQEDFAAKQIGATWTAEFLPLTVLDERWVIPRDPLQPEEVAALPAGVRVRLGRQGLLTHEYLTEAPAPFPLRLHAFWFPGWQATVDGNPVQVGASGRLGLVTADIPAGQHEVCVFFGDTAARQIGVVVTILGLLGLVVACLGGRGVRVTTTAGAVVLAAAALVLMWPAGAAQPARVDADLEGSIRLLGSRVDNKRTYAAAEVVEIDLYWMSNRMVPGYKVFVHVVDGGGAILAQHDGAPGGGFTPTTRWLPGEVVVDSHQVRLPDRLAPGNYTIVAGMYEFDTMRNLEARADTGAVHAGGRIPVGQVTVASP